MYQHQDLGSAGPLNQIDYPELGRFFDHYLPDVVFHESQFDGAQFQARPAHGLSWGCAGPKLKFMVASDTHVYASATTIQVNDVYNANEIGFTYETSEFATYTAGAGLMTTLPLSEERHGRYIVLNGPGISDATGEFPVDRTMSDQEFALARAGFAQNTRLFNWLFSPAGEHWFKAQGLI